jgi:hypothetical protein
MRFLVQYIDEAGIEKLRWTDERGSNANIIYFSLYAFVSTSKEGRI